MIGGGNMKIPCDLILDLLPLYQNNLCSEGSEPIITEHLSTCDCCHQVFEKMEELIDIPQGEMDTVFEKVLRAAYKRHH